MRAVLIVSLALWVAGVGMAQSAEASDGPLNGRISFGKISPAVGDFVIWSARADGSDQKRLTHVPSFFSDWSPNGRRIAFDFVDQTGVHVATMTAGGRQTRQLTFGVGVQEVPKWSPDGRWITFDASPTLPDDPAGFSTAIWIVRADGSHARRVSHGGFDVEPVFSPDGSQIAFARLGTVTPSGLQLAAVYVVNVDGTHLHRVIAARAGLEHPDWSPDSRWISFNITPEAGGQVGGAVMARHPDGTDGRVLHRPTARFVFFKAVWSPDGDKLLVGFHDLKIGIDKLCRIRPGSARVTVVINTIRIPVNFPAWGARIR